jgi:putative hydrolase of the HAD superfamily
MFFPDVIFFDAVGTLFGVKGSVGQIYGEIAQKFNVNTNYADLNRAFVQNFTKSSKIAFPHVSPLEIPNYEYAWWYDIAKSTFTQVGAFEQFADFDAYFSEMFEFFTLPDAWYIYDDVIPTLEYLQNKGIKLGIISNFDSRIYSVLDNLKLQNFFTSVTISTEVRAAKPDPHIFNSAIAKHHSQTNSIQNFWHVGDSFKEDYEGAKNANPKGNNLQGIWLDRSGNSPINENTISNFRDLICWIEL